MEMRKKLQIHVQKIPLNSRGPTVLDRDQSNKPRGRTRTEVFERPGT